MKLEKGLKFKGKWFKGQCEIDHINEEDNDLEVLITSEYGQTRMEHWNLEHTLIGFTNGDYSLNTEKLKQGTNSTEPYH